MVASFHFFVLSKDPIRNCHICLSALKLVEEAYWSASSYNWFLQSLITAWRKKWRFIFWYVCVFWTNCAVTAKQTGN